jgi:hypothetical protein
MMPRQPGDAVALREIRGGRIWSAVAATVVEDRGDEQRLFVPAGTAWKSPRAPDGRWLELPEPVWSLADRAPEPARAVLSFAFADRAFALMLFWDASWTPLTWYVNLQSPRRRTPVGFDYVDHVLDLLVVPDRSSWEWKDEDELEEAVRRGLFTPEDARAFRTDGEAALRLLLESRPPFDRDWTGWRPDPSWPPPELPAGWDRL